MDTDQSRITPEAFLALLEDSLPQAHAFALEILSLGAGRARLRLPYRDLYRRPGDTISGPTQMALADVGLYLVVMSLTGPAALAVTVDMNIRFLRKPALAPLEAEARILRLGRRLAVGEVTIYSAGDVDPVAHATGTYALPQPADNPA